jgi:hypothetical protein
MGISDRTYSWCSTKFFCLANLFLCSIRRSSHLQTTRKIPERNVQPQLLVLDLYIGFKFPSLTACLAFKNDKLLQEEIIFISENEEKNPS